MEFLGLRKNFEKHVLRLSPRNKVQREIHLQYISYYYRVKKQRLRKTAIWAYVRRGRVVIECSRAAEAAYYIELFFDLCLLGGEFTHCSTAIAGACYQCLALRVLSARLKHVIVSWWTSFSV